MELAYAGLHQLCASLLDRLDGLPPPQRQALEVAYGLSLGEAPDRFLVGLAVLSLVSDAADKRPILCLVDDTQWLDRGSALTLAFVARRLQAERVGVVFAVREPGGELAHLPQLEVRDLLTDDAQALLDATAWLRLDDRVSDRIVAETHGNPLALLELPRGLTARQLAGGFGLVEAQGITGRIEESFVRRVETVSDDARRLLLVAAAEPVGDPLLLMAASERLGIAVAAVDTETDGLLALGERVTFRHPLVRSAVYRTATREQLRSIVPPTAPRLSEPASRRHFRCSPCRPRLCDRSEEAELLGAPTRCSRIASSSPASLTSVSGGCGRGRGAVGWTWWDRSNGARDWDLAGHDPQGGQGA